MINGSTVPIGATYSPTGGTATDLVSLGSSLGANRFFLDNGSTLILRPTYEVSSNQPVAQSGTPNGYTQQRCTAIIHMPKLLANGNYTKNTVRVVVSYDPETSASERDDLWLSAAHVAAGTAFADFRDDGSVS